MFLCVSGITYPYDVNLRMYYPDEHTLEKFHDKAEKFNSKYDGKYYFLSLCAYHKRCLRVRYQSSMILKRLFIFSLHRSDDIWHGSVNTHSVLL